ncbi:MAG: cytosine permease [Nocardioides sp.]|uniref:purine-cytosine permease family protein n=1 Tax=Nocardioides sp. TaxID=35761 RepID=UPI0039E23C8B
MTSSDTAAYAAGDIPRDGGADPTAPLAIESHGIDVIPESERYGRPASLFGVWASANVNFLSFLVGTVLILIGLTIWQALAVALAGALFSVLTGIIAATGPASGTPSEVITRSMYGVRFNRINVALAGWLVSVCYLALNWATAAYFAYSLLDRVGIAVTTPVEVAVIVVIAAVTLAISVYGYGLIMRIYQPMAAVLGLVFVVMVVYVVRGADWSYTPQTTLSGTALWATLAAGLTLVASGPLSYTNSADFARYLPTGTPVRSVAVWTALGSSVPGVVVTGAGILAATAVDASDAQAAADVLLPSWFSPVFIVAVIVGTIANNAMTAYSSGLALQSIGVRMRRSRTVLLDGAVGTTMTLLGLLVWDFLDSVSNAMQLIVAILAPVMSIYLADMWLRRNRYDGAELSDQSPGSRFWYAGGVNPAGALALVGGVAVTVLCCAATVYTGPVASAIGGIDVSLPVGLILPGAAYLLLMRTWVDRGLTR